MSFGQLPTPPPTTARIIGDIQDGTPAAPAPPKPVFTVPAADVLKTETHQQGGRSITVREIKPIPLPEPAAIPAPPDPGNPAVRARIAALRDRQPGAGLFSIGATVYRSQSSGTRSIVTWLPEPDAPPVTFWSSADFSLLQGISGFSCSDGTHFNFIMMWSVIDMDQMTDRFEEYGKVWQPPAIPVFAESPATFSYVSADPGPEASAALQSLHDIYNSEHDRLSVAKQGRDQASLEQAARLKADPPVPRDIVLSHWLTETPDTNGKPSSPR
ncbi:hypothetical protein GCM10023212_32480 [Luteolibacter yonseiensis]